MAATLSPPVAAVAPPAQPAESRRFYHPELDGLRFFAFLAVFVFHAFHWKQPTNLSGAPLAQEVVRWLWSAATAGQVGVDLFFVLSAYLITELLLREQERTGRIDLRAFFIRRALRIWPLYFAFLAFVLLFESALLGVAGLTAAYAGPMALLAGNWAFVWLSAPPASTASVLWSVSIEEQFYIGWPLLFRWLTPQRLAWGAAGLLLLAWLVRAWLVSRGATHDEIYYNTFVRLDAIACGILAAVFLHRRTWRIPDDLRWLLIALGVLAPIAGIRYLRLTDVGPLADLVSYPLWALASLAILLGVLRPPGEARGLTSLAPTIYLGRISYGLYVVHYFAIAYVATWGWRPATLAHAGIALAATIAVASVSYQVLERPFLRWKERFAVVASRPVDQAG